MPNGTATDQQIDSSADEQSPATGDHAGQDDSGVDEQPTEGTEGTDEETDEEGESGSDSDDTEDGEINLLGKDQYEALKGDPEKLIKELNRAATKKFQKLSAERKALEPYRKFIEAVDADPVGTVTAVAKKLGIKIADGGDGNTDAVVKTLEAQISEAVRASMGPEYDDLSDKVAASIHAALKVAVPELTRDTREQVSRVVDDSAMRESQLVLETFGKAHPDWKKHENAMTELSRKFPPGEGVTEIEYLETLYTLATREGKNGDAVKKAVTRMAKSARAASSDGSTVPGDAVSLTPGKPPTFAQAAAAARRGQRFE